MLVIRSDTLALSIVIVNTLPSNCSHLQSPEGRTFLPCHLFFEAGVDSGVRAKEKGEMSRTERPAPHKRSEDAGSGDAGQRGPVEEQL